MLGYTSFALIPQTLVLARPEHTADIATMKTSILFKAKIWMRTANTISDGKVAERVDSPCHSLFAIYQ